MGHGADVLPERGTQRSVALSPNVPEQFMPNGGRHIFHTHEVI